MFKGDGNFGIAGSLLVGHHAKRLKLIIKCEGLVMCKNFSFNM
jgi:hypothetical protein